MYWQNVFSLTASLNSSKIKSYSGPVWAGLGPQSQVGLMKPVESRKTFYPSRHLQIRKRQSWSPWNGVQFAENLIEKDPKLAEIQSWP